MPHVAVIYSIGYFSICEVSSNQHVKDHVCHWYLSQYSGQMIMQKFVLFSTKRSKLSFLKMLVMQALIMSLLLRWATRMYNQTCPDDPTYSNTTISAVAPCGCRFRGLTLRVVRSAAASYLKWVCSEPGAPCTTAPMPHVPALTVRWNYALLLVVIANTADIILIMQKPNI